MGIWENLGPASFEVDGERVLFAVFRTAQYEEGLRLVRREVPWVDGEPLDETGLRARSIRVEIPFFNQLLEFDSLNIGTDPPMYPDRYRKFLALCRTKKTGNLNLFLERNIRVKAESWPSTLNVEERDGVVVSVTFIEDNEDRIDGPTQAQQLSARANLASVIQATFTEARKQGAWSDDWAELTRAASQLETTLNQPSEFLDTIDSRASRVEHAVDRVLRTEQQNRPGKDKLREASGAKLWRLLRALREMAARSVSESRPGRPVVRTRTFEQDISIWQIAAALGQDPDALLVLNPNLQDPNWIAAGTQVRVFA